MKRRPPRRRRTPADVGHINAHGLSTTDRDADEARAIREVFGPLADKVPVTALKSYFGNLGAGSGVVELIASVLALREGRLPRTLNYETPDPTCALAVTNDDNTARRPQLLEPQRHAARPGRRPRRRCHLAGVRSVDASFLSTPSSGAAYPHFPGHPAYTAAAENTCGNCTPNFC